MISESNRVIGLLRLACAAPRSIDHWSRFDSVLPLARPRTDGRTEEREGRTGTDMQRNTQQSIDTHHTHTHTSQHRQAWQRTHIQHTYTYTLTDQHEEPQRRHPSTSPAQKQSTGDWTERLDLTALPVPPSPSLPPCSSAAFSWLSWYRCQSYHLLSRTRTRPLLFIHSMSSHWIERAKGGGGEVRTNLDVSTVPRSECLVRSFVLPPTIIHAMHGVAPGSGMGSLAVSRPISSLH